MRLNDYLQNKYIGLVEKNKKSTKIKSNEINSILKKLNIILENYVENYKFDIVDECKSPTEVVNINNKKLEKITKKWMEVSEQLEDIKENHINTLQDD